MAENNHDCHADELSPKDKLNEFTSKSETELMCPVESLAALTYFQDERKIIQQLCNSNEEEKAKTKLLENDLSKFFPENWQISQFWYDKETTETLVNEIQRLVTLTEDDDNRVACISCPSVFRCCEASTKAHLYEYDKRFEVFGSSYIFYDYKSPEECPAEWRQSYSVVILDPPFLSDECLEKMSITVKMLVAPNAKIILCTALKMEEAATKYLGLRRTKFTPKHRNNGIKLDIEFGCFCNYDFGT